MEASDKVYYTQTEYVANYFTTGKPFERDCVEYIREDALMELLREKRNAITECSATEERKVAALSVIDFLIDKISKL